MKKIPSLFKRNHETGRVYDEVTPGCEWVIAGEGTSTRKWDGTCCRIKEGKLWKRYDAKHGKTPPEGFEPAQDPDPITGHHPGWIPVGDGPQDQHHRKAFEDALRDNKDLVSTDGTYELIGPKIQGNPEHMLKLALVRHGDVPVNAPRTFGELTLWFIGKDMEGIVWHHPDGRMCKIKKKDFGMSR